MSAHYTPKHWTFAEGDPDAQQKLQQELGLNPVVAGLLVRRGITLPNEAHAFLHPDMKDLHDPFLLPDADVACDRLVQALDSHEKILVHGDYDGDGISSAALWMQVLTALKADVEVFVPHRKRDGYDMRSAFVEYAKKTETKLIITTDCGIRRLPEVEQAREYGIDVIVTDHHQPGADGKLPCAVAVVNPHRNDSRYPFRDLSGVGVAFKLCEALMRRLGLPLQNFVRSMSELVAIGTITDVVPLLGENRILVHHGLLNMANTKKAGLAALLGSCGMAGKPISARDVAFKMGPRINAAGRVDESQLALDLLMSKDPAQSQSLAEKLNELNTFRQTEQKRVWEEAAKQLEGQDISEMRCLVLSGTGWPGGIIGIAAGKIVDRFARPCVMISMDSDERAGRGSARSIPGFNILNAIEECAPLLGEFGGHAMAAGLSIRGENVEAFRQQMNETARRQLTEEDCVPTLTPDMEVDPAKLNEAMLRSLEELAPFGAGNPEPLFVARGLHITDVRRLGAEKQHLQFSFYVEGMNGKDEVRAPWWYHGEMADRFGGAAKPGPASSDESAEQGLQPESLDVCFRANLNEWNGYRSVQFMVEDIKAPEW